MTALKGIGAASLSLLVLGCASARPIAPVDASSASYRSEALTADVLQPSGIAVLPVTFSQSGDGSTAERAGGRIAMALESRRVCAVVMHPADVKGRLALEGVSGRLEEMLASLPETGELDRATLGAMAEATGCRFFLQAHYRSGAFHHVAPVDGVPHGSRAVTSSLHAQLWDAVTGDVVWEGLGGGAALTNPPHGGTTEQTLTLAVNGLATMVARDAAPLPAPEDVVADLHHRDHLEAAAVRGENAARADAAVTGLHVLVGVLELAGAIAEIAD